MTRLNAYSSLLGFSLISLYAFYMDFGFLCSTSAVCAITGWVAHRDPEDKFWNTLDVWMVNGIAVGNFVATGIGLHWYNIYSVVMYFICLLGGIGVSYQFRRLKMEHWNETDHFYRVHLPSYLIILILSSL